MLMKISASDKIWLLNLLICLLYFFVLLASGCRWVDGPLAFVHGCHNYGIDWNRIHGSNWLYCYFSVPALCSLLDVENSLLLLHLCQYIYSLYKKADCTLSKEQAAYIGVKSEYLPVLIYGV
ncbi:MAG: hypothetical protein CDV28_1347 [Candidatus Electronema aureum]|uniref:Uncharacterized protein n=1 Tax=Candidatus Electronema aureum TaxID=2005002 RepID=A0A521FZN5_9BACT|nr:MAG: hypothetical protein CDV28_1347 [Candidatus Electronema aureum]